MEGGLTYVASTYYNPCHLLIWLSAYDAFVFKAFLKRPSRRELSAKRTTSIEQNSLASYVVQEHCVPGLHRPIGEQHIDLTRGIKVQRARIDDSGKDVFPIGLDGAIRRVEDGQRVDVEAQYSARQWMLQYDQKSVRPLLRQSLVLSQEKRRGMSFPGLGF